MFYDINFWLTIFSIIIPVFATIYTVNNRIKNQNKENHQPYIVLNKIEQVDNINIYKYHLVLKLNYEKNNCNNEAVYINMALTNIGYGVATNIKFYDLLTAEQLEGYVEKDIEKNQKLFTTFDMASTDQKAIQAMIISEFSSEKGNNFEKISKILCVYKDLHNNIYSFIICINLKPNKHYDFFAYQPSSLSYKRALTENKYEYKKIIKKYRDL